MLKASLFVSLAVLQLLGGVEGHGYVKNPPSRIMHCAGDGSGKNRGCRNNAAAAIQNTGRFPNCPFGSMDGVIASAMMATFRELDEQGADRWYKNPMRPGRNSFTWRLTANHQTKDFRYFITKNGWNPNAPLQVSTFEPRPFCQKSVNGKPPREVTHQCNVPNRNGYHVILAEWKIGDNTRSFYNVIDIDFNGRGGGGNGPAVVPAQPITRYHDMNIGGLKNKGFISKYFGKGRLCLWSRPKPSPWRIDPPLPCKVNKAQNRLQWNGNNAPRPQPAPRPRPPAPRPQPQPRPPAPRPQPQPRPPQNNGGCRWRVRAWGNCHRNKNCCVSGYRCVRKNQWYSQCVKSRNNNGNNNNNNNNNGGGRCSNNKPTWPKWATKHSCDTLKKWKKCGKNFMRGKCNRSCGRC